MLLNITTAQSVSVTFFFVLDDFFFFFEVSERKNTALCLQSSNISIYFGGMCLKFFSASL